MLTENTCIFGKNTSLTSAKNKDKLEYISERQSLPIKLAFKVELNLLSHFKSYTSQYLLD